MNDKTDGNNDFQEADGHLNKMIKSLQLGVVLWLIVGCVSFSGALWLSYTTYYETIDLITTENGKLLNTVSWVSLLILLIRNIILISLPTALATYSFNLSKAYTHERLKRAERRHAINFGKYFIGTHAENAKTVKKMTPTEISRIFQWNIDNETAFMKKNSSSFDVNSIDFIAKLIDLVQKLEKRDEKNN